MAKESGIEYNPESASHLRPKDFSFDAYGYVFRFTLEIPEYILRRIESSAVMDKLCDHMSEHARAVVVAAMKGGYMHSDSGEATMRADVGKHLRNYIWERFSISQEEAGQACWQTAPSLQEVRA
jgi:hypothetical protein